MALYLVIGTLIIVAILVKAIMTAIVSQQRIGRHNTARIQAYYAALAGMNYAFEKLRAGEWVMGTNCTSAAPCDIYDSELPYPPIGTFNTTNTTATQQFRVIFCPAYSTCAPSTLQCRPPYTQNYCVDVSVKYNTSNIPT